MQSMLQKTLFGNQVYQIILNWSFDYELRLSDNVIVIPEELDLGTTGKYFPLTSDLKIYLLIV